MTPADTGHDIATPEEVLATFTQLMRSEKTSEQLKAAEQLAKYHSLFTPRESAGFSPELIAQTPVEPRDHSRLMVVHRGDGSHEHKHFYDIIEYLEEDPANEENVTRIKNYLAVNGAK